MKKTIWASWMAVATLGFSFAAFAANWESTNATIGLGGITCDLTDTACMAKLAAADAKCGADLDALTTEVDAFRSSTRAGDSVVFDLKAYHRIDDGSRCIEYELPCDQYTCLKSVSTRTLVCQAKLAITSRAARVVVKSHDVTVPTEALCDQVMRDQFAPQAGQKLLQFRTEMFNDNLCRGTATILEMM